MNVLLFLLLSTALIWIQCLIGGTRLLFAFPSYIVLGGTAILSILFVRKPVAKPSTPALVSTLLLAGYVIGRALYSPVEYLSWDDLSMTGGCLLLYLITALYFADSRARLALAIPLMAAAVGQTAIAWVQHTRQADFMLFGFEGRPNSGDLIRGTGMFISGNHLAGYLETVAMLALGIAFWSRWRWPGRLLALAVVLVCYSGVAISGSRGGYLSSAFSLLVFAVLSVRAILKSRGETKPGRRWLPLIGVAGGVAILVASAAYFGTRNELVMTRFEMIGKKDVRIYNWQAALDQFHTAPWFGTGAGTHLIYGRLFRRPELQADPVHAHGDYLEMLAEYGAVGGALSFLFLAIHLGKGFLDQGRIATARLRTTDGGMKSDTLALNIGAWAGLAALLSHSVVDFNMHIPANALLYALLFGILANPGAARPAVAGWAAPSTLLRMLLPALGGALIGFAAPKLEGEKLAEEARKDLRDHDFQKVLKVAKSAIAAEPRNPYPWFYLGEANRLIATRLPVPHLRERYFTNAVHSFQNGLERLPHDHSLLVRLAQSLDGLNRHDEAEAAYREALLWDPNLFVLHAYYGAHLKLVGKHEEAKEAFRNARHLKKTGAAEAEALMKHRARNQADTGIDGTATPAIAE